MYILRFVHLKLSCKRTEINKAILKTGTLYKKRIYSRVEELDLGYLCLISDPYIIFQKQNP